MTVKEVIDKVGTLRRNNQFTIEDKMWWLNQIEAKIQIDCLLMPCVAIQYKYPADEREILIAKAPHDELYVYYICAKIDEALGEMARYNDTIALFNQVNGEYQKYIIRTVNPKHNRVELVRDCKTIFRGDKIDIKLFGLPVMAEDVTQAKATLTQRDAVTEIDEVNLEKDTLSFTLSAAQSYALSEGHVDVGYDITANGYRYCKEAAKTFYVKDAPELEAIAEGEVGSPVDASLTIYGRAADAGATGAAFVATKEAIEKRSADYGLGAVPKEYILNDLEEIDNLPVNGFYHLKFNEAMAISGYEFTECGCEIRAIGNYPKKIELWIVDNEKGIDSYVVRKTIGDSVTGEWEWVTTPMKTGVEYRTTERYNGEPIYVKRIVTTALPANNKAEYSVGVNVTQIKSLDCVAYDGDKTTALILPSASISVWINNYKRLVIKAEMDASVYTAYVTMKYTK